ncbi:MAG: hypothetical protein ACKVU1_11945 [bacterium]
MRTCTKIRAAARHALCVAILASGILGLARGAAIAAPRAERVNPLSGAGELHARVERIPPSLEETGVTHARLDSLLFARLAAGRVTAAEPQDDSREGLLTLSVTYLLHSGWHIASVDLNYSRATALISDPNTHLTATVWSRSGIVIAKKKKLLAEVESTLDEMLAEFVEDYRAANPR